MAGICLKSITRSKISGSICKIEPAMETEIPLLRKQEVGFLTFLKYKSS